MIVHAVRYDNERAIVRALGQALDEAAPQFVADVERGAGPRTEFDVEEIMMRVADQARHDALAQPRWHRHALGADGRDFELGRLILLDRIRIDAELQRQSANSRIVFVRHLAQVGGGADLDVACDALVRGHVLVR